MEKIVLDGIEIIKTHSTIFIAIAAVFAGAGYWFAERLSRKTIEQCKSEVVAIKGQMELNIEAKKLIEARMAELQRRQSQNDDDLVNRKTMRPEVTFGEAVESAGLVDIEWRDTKQKSLPPSKFYAAAKNEVFVLGISCKHTLTNDADELTALLRSGKRVRLMLLDPDSQHATQLCEREGFSLKDDIRHAIQMAETKGLFDYRAQFSIRLTAEVLPYTSVMIDGDIDCPRGQVARDGEGQLRIQPRTFFKSQHNGLVCQFRHIGTVSAYQYFSADLRELWRGGKEVVAIPVVRN